jgi:hypothetical protein
MPAAGGGVSVSLLEVVDRDVVESPSAPIVDLT